MTPEQKTAYQHSMAIAAYAEIEGMKATNAVSAIRGEYPVWNEADFKDVIEKYGIHHNAICSLFEEN